MGVTFRSVVIGLILIPLNTLWVVLAELGWYSGFPTCLSLFFNAVFCVFVLVVGNLAVERLRPAWALHGTEILVVYTMICIASGLAGTWSMDRLWVCVIIGWLLKVAVLRYGGVKAYRPAVPFFIGLILGDFMVGAFWNLYGIVMEVQVYRFWF